MLTHRVRHSGPLSAGTRPTKVIDRRVRIVRTATGLALRPRLLYRRLGDLAVAEHPVAVTPSQSSRGAVGVLARVIPATSIVIPSAAIATISGHW